MARSYNVNTVPLEITEGSHPTVGFPRSCLGVVEIRAEQWRSLTFRRLDHEDAALLALLRKEISHWAGEVSFHTLNIGTRARGLQLGLLIAQLLDNFFCRIGELVWLAQHLWCCSFCNTR